PRRRSRLREHVGQRGLGTRCLTNRSASKQGVRKNLKSLTRGGLRMAVERRARSVWTGTLTEGEGKLTAESSGVFTDLPVTWAARSEERSGGKTSPEELLAAAHASCFSMALSNGLTKAGTPPEGPAVA